MAYRQEVIKPYSAEGDKGTQVGAMFDHIAPVYDRLNHLLSLGIDRQWRRRSLRALAGFQPRRILDISTGTGDFAILTARMLRPERIVGADISEGMMAVARQKVEREGLSGVVSFSREDCQSLSFESDSFDAVTVAFGVRNYADLDTCLREMCRVLRPGGHLLILELSAPARFPMRELFRLYAHTLMPATGRLLSHDRQAYNYLTASVEAFPQAEQMAAILARDGFQGIQWRRYTCGICTMYLATPKK
ncbi:MAG: bifunctional demethylmenaquinone methyltransferase/2-methoxy-6-polyprenyl-1,4-benzoquinol methylase UbiE [Prevotellaceae bacterium]|nr:bifunctional demethylmenaquinone methyltransferase/2-methoxy-6-polyprenyl-1,4-benzoquinol methylase UbiE [Prevotellaceae bacterium]